MSKSLKNFISIEDYLSGRWLPGDQSCEKSRRDAADDLRIFFLHHKYHSSLHFSKDRIDEAGVWRKKVSNTLSRIRSVINENNNEIHSDRQKRMSHGGRILLGQLYDCKAKVNDAFSDDFDTPLVMRHLVGLCSKANVYLEDFLGDSNASTSPLPEVYSYLHDLVHIFGLQFANMNSVYL